MTYLVKFEPDVNCTFVKAFGVFDPVGMHEHILDIISNPSFNKGMNILRDLTERRVSPEISFKSISAAASKAHATTDQTMGPCKFAFVVGDSIAYAKVHQFIVTGRLKTNPVERHVFRSVIDTRKWLDIPDSYELVYPDSPFI